MADIFSKKQRSWVMSQVKSKETKAEIKVRKFLFGKGFRYRKNDRRFPGKPDIVLPRYKTIIFIHGCFWHGHVNCKHSNLPKSNEEYWSEKIGKNILRDKMNEYNLVKEGWRIIVVWECNIQELLSNFSSQLKLVSKIKNNR